MNSDKEIAFEPENEFGAKSIGFFQNNKETSSLKIWLTKENRDSVAVTEIQQMLSSFGIKPENVELFDDLEKSPEVRNLIRIQHGAENPVLTCGNTILGDLETLKTAYTYEDLKKLVVGNEQGLLNVEESTTSLPPIGFAHQIVDGVKKVTSMINPFAYFNGPPTYTHPDKEGKWGEEFDVICENYYGRQYIRKLYFMDDAFIRADSERVIKDQIPYTNVKKLEVCSKFLVIYYEANPSHPSDKVFAISADLLRIVEILIAKKDRKLEVVKV